MEPWVLCLILALVFTAIGLFQSSLRAASRARPTALHRDEGGLVSINYNDPLPAVWDEQAITRQLAHAKRQPQLLTYYVDVLKQRFILNVEDRTAQVRTQFLRRHVEELQVGKEYKVLIHDLQAMEVEQGNRLLRLGLERRDLEAKHQQAEELDGLRLEKDRLAIEVEIAELRAKMQAIETPTPPPPIENRLSPEQQRRIRRMEIEDKLRELDRLEADAVKASKNDEDRLRIENMYTDKRQELHEQLSKFLV